jgi:integrase
VGHSPVSDGSSLKRSKIAKRLRRLFEDEEKALLAVAAPRLYWIMVGALETGMRLGELLALTWRDVDRKERVLTVRAENAKDDETRLLPISKRLDDVLEMAKSDPAGREFPADDFVFGNELGERGGSIKKAWETAVLKAHGIKPQWLGGKLSADCRAQLRRIDLHFHDLRREAASRWHEGGFSLHEVRDLRGHSKREPDRHLSGRKDCRPANENRPVRRSAWQSVANAASDRAPASLPRRNGGKTEGPCTVAVTTMCARSSGG